MTVRTMFWFDYFFFSSLFVCTANLGKVKKSFLVWLWWPCLLRANVQKCEISNWKHKTSERKKKTMLGENVTSIKVVFIRFFMVLSFLFFVLQGDFFFSSAYEDTRNAMHGALSSPIQIVRKIHSWIFMMQLVCVFRFGSFIYLSSFLFFSAPLMLMHFIFDRNQFFSYLFVWFYGLVNDLFGVYFGGFFESMTCRMCAVQWP